MKKTTGASLPSDCPGLDNGPASAEHEGRFVNQGAQQGTAAKSTLSDLPDAQNPQNHKKEKDISS